ncbi:GAP family protein [Arthrobacter sp. AQ5-05]|uniref:GAP family protein n=1 Tax=Arthrobacter sp. AQ5-05 TaxID=2184581 RepID=UPI000DE5AA62|nr:GAP family protein [Arthrobacter sp. AQ5-05]
MMLGTTGLFASLAVLALIDATSIGTLVIPVWLVLRAKPRGDLRSALAYLGVLGSFYLAVGLLLLGGVDLVSREFTGALLGSWTFRWAVLLLGAGMLAWSFRKNPDNARAASGAVPAGAGRSAADTGRAPAPAQGTACQAGQGAEGRWARRLDTALASPWGIAGLGVTAGLLELPTMLPYPGAIGLLPQSPYSLPVQSGLLVLYCLVMLLPGAAVIGIRAVAGPRFQGPLVRLSAWLAKSSPQWLPWIVGILGFLMARSSLAFLFPTAGWNPFK